MMGKLKRNWGSERTHTKKKKNMEKPKWKG